jgi:hypothetical protein
MRLVAALVVLATTTAGAGDAPLARRESAAEVGAAIAGLRGGPPRAEPRAVAPERLYVVVPALTPERRAVLEGAGLRIELPLPGQPVPPWRDGAVVQGWAAPAARAAIASLPFVVRVEQPGEAWTNVGSVTTAGDAVVAATTARGFLGTDGAGVVVGVISDGIDDRAASIATGDLPPDIGMPLPALGPGSGTEGTALLEILHDVAPGAGLLFAPARTSAEMVAAIDGLAAAGAHVIVDDLVFTDEPKFEDGPIALAARRFASGGGVYVAAAGNFARLHYYATYVRGRSATFSNFTYPALHAFAPADFGNGLRIPAGGQVLVVLQWNDPFGGSQNDFDLVLARPANGGDVVLAASTAEQSGSGNPYEALRWQNATGASVDAYLAVAEFARVSEPALLRLNLHVFSRVSPRLQYSVARESVFGHAAVEEVLSVAAADVRTPDILETFSARGPATIFFPAQATRRVPRLTAVDGVETAVGRRGSFVNPFHGTSAAVPHVGGCAALLRAAGVSSEAARAGMEASAIDAGPAGFDTLWGAGRLDCAAAARVATGASTPPRITAVAARFEPAGGIHVTAQGDDADADTQAVVVRLLDAAGDELTRQTYDVARGVSPFTVDVALLRASLATARTVGVQARDLVGLAGPELTAPFACPGDGSLGDTLCALGDVIARLADGGGRARLERAARLVGIALVRAARATETGRVAQTRGALRAASARLRRLVRKARRVSGAPVAEAERLRTQVRTLRDSIRDFVSDR